MAHTEIIVPRSFGWGGTDGGKLRPMLIGLAANSEDHESRVTDLEEAVTALDPEALEGVDGLGERLTALEATVDTEGTGLADEVAALLVTVDTADTGLTDRVEVLEAAVEALDPEALEDVEGLDERIEALETTVDTAETGIVDRVEALETTVDTADTGLTDRMDAVETTLDTADTGLVDRVEALETTVDTADTGVVDRLDAVETTLDTADTGIVDRVEALETTVDTADTGLTDRVDALETTLDTADTGIVDRVEALETTIDTADTGLTDRVDAIETTLDTADTGVVDRLEAVETTLDTADTGIVDRVDALEGTVGDAEAGLVKDVSDLEAAVDVIEYDFMKRALVALAGRSPSKYVFGSAVAATLLGVGAGPYVLDHGLTFIVTGDGTEQTITFAATVGTHTGDTGCSTDMTAESDTKFKIRANGDTEWHTITCDWVGGSCDSGAEIAAEIQAKVRALGATYGYDAITCAFSVNKLVFTSAQKGTGSTIEIDRAADHDACDDLDIGPNGVTAAGTGDAVNIAATTIGEVITKCAGLNKLTATDGTTGLRLTSKTTGNASGLVIGAGTATTALGFVEAAANYGASSLSLTPPLNTNYTVCATLDGVAQGNIADKGISVTNRTVDGFQIECETAAATDNVGLIILYTPA